MSYHFSTMCDGVFSKAILGKRTEQTEQNRTEQSRAEQNRWWFFQIQLLKRGFKQDLATPLGCLALPAWDQRLNLPFFSGKSLYIICWFMYPIMSHSIPVHLIIPIKWLVLSPFWSVDPTVDQNCTLLFPIRMTKNCGSPPFPFPLLDILQRIKRKNMF